MNLTAKALHPERSDVQFLELDLSSGESALKSVEESPGEYAP